MRADCDPSIPGDCDCDPSIEQCYVLVEGENEQKIERYYGVVEMVVLVMHLIGQIFCILIPLLTGVKATDLTIPTLMA